MHLTADTTEENSPAVETGERAGKYLVFGLGREEFGIQVLRVQEIIGVQHATAIPRAPAYIKGVINLRGKVIPVVELRVKFGLAEVEYTPRTCIIVIQVRSEANPMVMGIVVDHVVEVLNLLTADIEDTPDFGEGVVIPHLLGVAKIKGKVRILLDIDAVLTSPEVQRLDALIQAG